jgi:hypothetical protein
MKTPARFVIQNIHHDGQFWSATATNRADRPGAWTALPAATGYRRRRWPARFPRALKSAAAIIQLPQ